jgi:hypothetical protein
MHPEALSELARLSVSDPAVYWRPGRASCLRRPGYGVAGRPELGVESELRDGGSMFQLFAVDPALMARGGLRGNSDAHGPRISWDFAAPDLGGANT